MQLYLVSLTVRKRPGTSYSIEITELSLTYLETRLQYLASQKSVRKNMAICDVFYVTTLQLDGEHYWPNSTNVGKREIFNSPFVY